MSLAYGSTSRGASLLMMFQIKMGSYQAVLLGAKLACLAENR